MSTLGEGRRTETGVREGQRPEAEGAREGQRRHAEVRERAQMILGAVSLVAWFVVAFGLAIAWYVDDNTPRPIFMAGGIALIVAAMPWLAYAPLVRRLRRN